MNPNRPDMSPAAVTQRLRRVAELVRIGRALLWSVAAFGVATVAFGVSRWFPLSVAMYMAVGMADQVSMVMRQITIQLSTPDHLRGRVTAVNQVFVGTSNQLGAVESGFVAAATSATFAVVSGGIGCLAVLGIVVFVWQWDSAPGPLIALMRGWASKSRMLVFFPALMRAPWTSGRKGPWTKWSDSASVSARTAGSRIGEGWGDGTPSPRRSIGFWLKSRNDAPSAEVSRT